MGSVIVTGWNWRLMDSARLVQRRQLLWIFFRRIPWFSLVPVAWCRMFHVFSYQSLLLSTSDTCMHCYSNLDLVSPPLFFGLFFALGSFDRCGGCLSALFLLRVWMQRSLISIYLNARQLNTRLQGLFLYYYLFHFVYMFRVFNLGKGGKRELCSYTQLIYKDVRLYKRLQYRYTTN